MNRKQSSVTGFDPRLIRLVESVLVTDFNRRRKAWADNCDHKDSHELAKTRSR